MNFLLTGLNHKTAPVELRERLDIPDADLPFVTEQVLRLPGVQEAMILSTCNRVEILIAHRASSEREGADPDVASFLEQHFGLADAGLREHLYHHREVEAVRHIFRVACSLDSLVLGEPQILGQVKAAYNAAREYGAVGSQLERLLQDTFALAKRVRTETEIGASPVSISTVAVDLARRIFGELDGKRVMLVGAGKMSELAARHLAHHGAERILVANRTFSRAESLAQKFGGSAVEFDSIFSLPDPPDILITSTGSPRPILSVDHIQQFLHRRRHKPILMIDIAVPRDIDPEVNRLEGAFLYDIDDLQSVASSNLVDRKRQAELAEEMVAAEALKFEQRRRALDIGPLIASMQHTIEQLCQAEMKRVGPRLQSLTKEQQAAVKMLARGLTNKFLHLPMHALRNAAQSGDVEAVRAIQAAFDPSGLRDFSAEKDTCPHTGIRIEEVRVDPEDSDAMPTEQTIPVNPRHS
ncbi:MAG: glutamyl-tRNA reductase [Acidobacteria bacterium]|jgi:glutamyl-tRNA reductase|nr:glutamyl-tRNA reductase [Acidobacteriota bacterium]